MKVTTLYEALAEYGMRNLFFTDKLRTTAYVPTLVPQSRASLVLRSAPIVCLNPDSTISDNTDELILESSHDISILTRAVRAGDMVMYVANVDGASILELLPESQPI